MASITCFKLLKASNGKNGSHEFPEFLLEKFRNFGTWGKTEFPEIRKSEFPELQSLNNGISGLGTSK